MRVLRLAHHAVVSAWRERERRLRALGVDVDLVSAREWNEGGASVRLDPEGDEFVVGARTWGRHPSVFGYDPRPIWRLLGLRPDLIDLHEEPNSLAAAEVLLLRWMRGSTAPYVLYSAQNLEKRYPIPFRWIERRTLKGAAAAYVCNTEAGEILRRKGLRGPAVQIPLGVDVDVFRPAVKNGPSDPVVIAYVGRLESHKGVDVLLHAVAASSGLVVEITGDGPEREELEQLAVEIGIGERVRFLGHAGADSLPERYRAADVVVVPSRPWPGWREQFCRVAVEAMASGVPVVASRSGAIPDVVGTSGILVPPDDPEALAAAIAEALDGVRWRELRAAGLERARAFTWERVADQHASMYRAAVGGSRPIEAVVVAYGPAEPLEKCLSALGAGIPVTIVDNSSSAETAAVAAAHGAHYVDAGRNLGFAAGVNLGLREIANRSGAGIDVLLLNPDARIDGRSVARMHNLLASAPNLAAVGATQSEPDSAAVSRVWWPFPTPAGAWIEALGLGMLRRRRGFAIGSVLLLRAEALAQLGGLDERFFLYSEETDWQYRARRAGWRIEVADVVATHVGAGTGGDPSAREAHFYGSLERYVLKHYGVPGWRSFRMANLFGARLRGALLPGERGAAARRRAGIFARGPVEVEKVYG